MRGHLFLLSPGSEWLLVFFLGPFQQRQPGTSRASPMPISTVVGNINAGSTSDTMTGFRGAQSVEDR